jgi:Ni,Fe-hydrogenase III small subunit/formate hydrogenlyase subunit 6/NADH:ubiquinone oxidoreductase subunit I
MFKILEKTFRTGIVTKPYPKADAEVSGHFRGLPEFDFAAWRDVRPAADACPAGAIVVEDAGRSRAVTIDYGRCIFCGECAAAAPGAVRVTQKFEAAVTARKELILTAEYELDSNGRQGELIRSDSPAPRIAREIHRLLGRSLAIREVDAGSCNACELEINALNNPIHDIERFGIHFVASPRHADMLLVTGPVTRNMELALKKTYDATPDPKIVVAVGACGISGGIFGTNYATRGGVDRIIPVDVYVPGCPPRPQALLYGILLAVGRLKR